MSKKYLSLVLLFACFSVAFCQTTIYSENFTGQNGKGAIGSAPNIDISGVNWTIDISGINLLDETNDFFWVEDENFRGRDLNGSGIWLSPIIDILGFTNVQFSLDASETGNMNATDILLTEYSINGGAWVTATNNGNLTNDFPLTVVSDNGLVGNTIQLRVTMTNNNNGESHIIDNVLIEGTTPVNPTVIVNPSSINRFGYVEGENSLKENTFTVQGFNLVADIVLTAPANFEISTTTGAGFGNTITLTQTAGIVNLSTIYVRLVSGLVTNTYNGLLTATSTSVATKNVTFNGDVTAPLADCSELIISEYHEAAGGTPNEKFIEIYNPTTTVIDLANYRLALYPNGRGRIFLLNLAGTINPYNTYLLSKDGSTLCASGVADECTSSNVLNFNGDDAIALQTLNGENIDVIGIIGDPNPFAQNVALRRNAAITTPTITYDASQWSIVAANNTDNLGRHLNDCQCTGTTTWTLTGWDNGVPDINTEVIIDADYDTNVNGGSFSTCSLIINPNTELTINNGQFIEVEHGVIVNDNASIIVASQGSFIQNGDGINAGGFILNGSANAQVNKSTSPLNNWFDYTYWSSPVATADVDVALGFANPERRFLYNANNYLSTSPDGIDDNGDDWTNATGSGLMEIGRGYAATHTQIGFVAGNQYEYNFAGAFNTGDYAFPLAYNAANANHWNFAGNPYPSAIDVDLLFAGNTSINNAIYLWSHFRAPLEANPGNEVFNFSQNDYLIINETMELGNGSDLNGDGVIDNLVDIPARKIPSGQGFFVSSLSANPLLFNNSMRVSGNDEFYRNTNTSQYNKLWINLNSDNGVYSQTGIGYIDGATNNYDGLSYDAKRQESYTNAAIIYSIIESENNSKFAIQGRSIEGLSVTEVIPLGFTTNITESTIYTIKALKYEGEFLNNNDIYLKDNLLNTIHNLKDSDYNFTSEVGEFNNRFEIVFTAEVLSVNDNSIDPNQLIITELLNGEVQIKVNNTLNITNVEILDMLGRRIYNLTGSNSVETYDLSALSKTTYIARVTLSNGQIINKKSIKQQ